MSDGENQRFHFLPTVSSHTKTGRDVELLKSSARSHLARKIHKERRQKASLLGVKLKSTSFVSDTTPAFSALSTACNVVSLPLHAPCVQGECPYLSHEKAKSRGIPLVEVGSPQSELSYNESLPIKHSNPDQCLDWSLSHTQEEDYSRVSAIQTSFRSTLSSHRPNGWTTVSKYLSSLHSLRLFEYCGTRLWKGYNPGLDMRDQYTPLHTLARGTSDAGSCLYFNAQMWQAAIHLSIQQREVITSAESLRYHQRALRMIAQDLTKPTSELDQTTVFSMFGLCFPEPKSFEIENNLNDGFRSPLLEIQWIGLLGRQPLVETHLDAVFRIVELKGGIDDLYSFPTTYGIQYLDVIQSTFNLSKPRYPIAKMFQNSEIVCNRNNLFGLKDFVSTEDLLNSIADTRTLPLQRLTKYGISKDVFEVMLDLRVWSRLLRRLRNEMNVKIGGSLLALRRNTIQHKLLQTINTGKELIKGSETGGQSHSSSLISLAITDMVRTGLLIFAIGVTFPIRYSPLYETLILELQRLIERHFSMLLERELNGLIVWLCMLGCLATTRAPSLDSKNWFIHRICQVEMLRAQLWASQQSNAECQDYVGLTEELRYSLSWDQVRESCLTPFVWNDDACNTGGQLIWFEVQTHLAETACRK